MADGTAAMEMSPDSFRTVMGLFATGVTVVTTEGWDGHPYGVTVNSFSSLSLDPLLVLICLDVKLSGLEHFERAGRFAVNILSEDQAEESAFFSQHGTNRSDFSYVRGQMGLPLLKGCLARLVCELVDSHPAGDHKILIGKVVFAERRRPEGKPLVFYDGRYTRLAPGEGE